MDRSARIPRVPAVVLAGLLLVLAAFGALVWRAHSKINTVALASAPKPVTVVAASDTTAYQRPRKGSS